MNAKMKIGTYEVNPKVKEFELLVCLDGDSKFSTRSMFEAEVLSRLVRIENLLRK